MRRAAEFEVPDAAAERFIVSPALPRIPQSVENAFANVHDRYVRLRPDRTVLLTGLMARLLGGAGWVQGLAALGSARALVLLRVARTQCSNPDLATAKGAIRGALAAGQALRLNSRHLQEPGSRRSQGLVQVLHPEPTPIASLAVRREPTDVLVRGESVRRGVVDDHLDLVGASVHRFSDLNSVRRSPGQAAVDTVHLDVGHLAYRAPHTDPVGGADEVMPGRAAVAHLTIAEVNPDRTINGGQIDTGGVRGAPGV